MKTFFALLILIAQIASAQPAPAPAPVPTPAPSREEIREDIKGTLTTPTREQRQNVQKAAEKAKKKKDCKLHPEAPECKPAP